MNFKEFFKVYCREHAMFVRRGTCPACANSRAKKVNA